MSNRFNHSNSQSKFEAFEDDKYMKVFQHLESVNLRNKAAFDELLKYTYRNIKQPGSNSTNNPQS